MKTIWEDETVRIRPFREADVEPYFEAVRVSSAQVGRWLSWCHDGYTLAEAEAWVASRAAAWEKGEAYCFVLERKQDGLFLGATGLNTINPLHRFCNLFYWVRSDAAGKGYTTAGARLTAQFGFSELGVMRIEIVTDVENRASRRVAEKVGALWEGVERNRLFHARRGEAMDGVMYALIPSDFGY